MKISIIAAVAANGAIGNQNKLLYWLPNDLKRFKALTTGHTVIMGRRTFESLPKGALPNRRNIVLTKNAHFTAENTETFASLQQALAACKPDEDVFVIGGASVQEVHGLWEMRDAALGGAFVALERVDTAARRVLVTEGFIYSPHSPKRDLMRQMEAALRTFQ